MNASILINKFLKNSLVRYLIVGGVNIVFGYFIGIVFYYILKNWIPTFGISLLSNIVGVLFAFILYKVFVFKTVGHWVSECIKCFIVYGIGILFAALFLAWLVDDCLWPFWVAQFFSLLTVTIFSYIGHKFFTFKTYLK